MRQCRRPETRARSLAGSDRPATARTACPQRLFDVACWPWEGAVGGGRPRVQQNAAFFNRSVGFFGGNHLAQLFRVLTRLPRKVLMVLHHALALRLAVLLRQRR